MVCLQVAQYVQGVHGDGEEGVWVWDGGGVFGGFGAFLFVFGQELSEVYFWM